MCFSLSFWFSIWIRKKDEEVPNTDKEEKDEEIDV